MLTPFDAVAKLLNKNNMTFEKKMNLFFVDFELVPLLVQENYLTPYNANMGLTDITKAAESADYISLGDCVSNVLRNNNSWELLPNVGLCSAIAPTTLSAGFLKFAKFPQYNNNTIKN